MLVRRDEVALGPGVSSSDSAFFLWLRLLVFMEFEVAFAAGVLAGAPSRLLCWLGCLGLSGPGVLDGEARAVYWFGCLGLSVCRFECGADDVPEELEVERAARASASERWFANVFWDCRMRRTLGVTLP